MAYVKCSGGGKLRETILWENPSPTKGFTSQTVTLSDNISNYIFIKVRITGSSSLQEPYVDYLFDNFSFYNNKYNTSGANGKCITIGNHVGAGEGNNVSTARKLYYLSDTEINFSSTSRLGTSGKYDGFSIPIKIFGIK